MFYKLKIYIPYVFGVHFWLNVHELWGTLLCKHIFCMYVLYNGPED